MAILTYPHPAASGQIAPVQIPRPASSDIIRLHPWIRLILHAGDRNPHPTVSLLVLARAEAADPR
jgi:hypothetical protein